MPHNLSFLSSTLANGRGEIIPVSFREKGICVLTVREVRHILNAPEKIIGWLSSSVERVMWRGKCHK